ncbi:MAG: mandelate racemase/muconate lactonizing enzyme family protein [Myxococcota bacterium]
MADATTILIVDAEVLEAGGPVRTPVRSATRDWSERRGLLLRLRDREGGEGWGEASPLPGYSPDSLHRVGAVLRSVPFDGLPPLDPGRPLGPQLEAALQRVGPGAPSAQFAVETALLDLCGRRWGAPVHRLLGGSAETRPVPLCALVDGDDEEAVARSAEAAVAGGMRALKLKIGADPSRDRERAMAVRRAVGTDVSLRLDANGSFREDRAVEALEALRCADPELVEEPVAPHVVRRLGRWPVPLGADESLQDARARPVVEALTREGAYRAWVLKPMALGGALACMRLAARARAAGADPIVSHLFDGPIALAAAAELALALGGRRAAGLAPHVGLSAWPERPLAALSGGHLVPHDRPGLGWGEA